MEGAVLSRSLFSSVGLAVVGSRGHMGLKMVAWGKMSFERVVYPLEGHIMPPNGLVKVKFETELRLECCENELKDLVLHSGVDIEELTLEMRECFEMSENMS
ncbi:hypothetical protein BU17DRAFT_70711 [Hysterangium stoloniferum]|nr:hypothetical protein BU17DRAFT_70711 [Hysterangium stoloniferum]